METINDKCCESIKEENCPDRLAPTNVYNVYVGPSSCCSAGSDNGTSDHDQLDNKNLGIQHDASAIGFADGETFQEKYDKGELTGPQGDQGPQGEPGLQGDKGDAGLSAYEVAVYEGFIGTEADWIESLKGDIGPKGADGATGPQGPQGATGVSGSNGFSPVITVAEQTDSTYKLNIKTATNDFDTPNLKGADGTAIGGQVIGVVGTLERKALAAGVNAKIRFIPTEGDVSDINATGEWICPKDGIYDLYAEYGGVPSIGILHIWFQLNSPDFYSRSSTRGYSNNTPNSWVPASSVKLKLSKGDNISLRVASDVNQATAEDYSSFAITLDSSINSTDATTIQALQGEMANLKQTVQELKAIIEN